MKNYLKTGLLVAATLAATSVFSHSLPPPRPLLAKSAKECNPSYLEAIKPTQIEIDSMFATAVELTVSYLKEDGSLKQTIAGSERDVKRMIVNKEFYENSILAPGVKRLKELEDSVDRCLAYAKDLKPTQETLDRTLLSTVKSGKDVLTITGVMGRLIRMGASIEGSLPQSKDTFWDIPSGAMFPLLVQAATEGSFAHTSDKQAQYRRDQRVDLVSLLISRMSNPSSINSRAIDTKTGPTALELATIAGDDRVITVLLDAGADPRVVRLAPKEKATKSLVDVYTGKDMNIVKRLAGAPQPFAKPNTQEVLARISVRSDYD